MDTTEVTVDSSNLLNPYTALDSTGELITGNITYNTISGGTKTPTTSNQTLANAGWNYLSSDLIMAGSSNLTAANIKNGVPIFGVTGTLVGSSYTQIYSGTQTINTTSTSATSVTTAALGSSYYTSDKIIYVKIRDKAGPRNGYFTGSDAFFFNPYKKNGTTTNATKTLFVTSKSSSGTFTTYVTTGTSGYGVYAYSLNSSGQLAIYRRYNSTNSLTINGTYDIKVYALDYAPAQGNPYDYSSF